MSGEVNGEETQVQQTILNQWIQREWIRRNGLDILSTETNQNNGLNEEKRVKKKYKHLKIECFKVGIS